jgi:hypothetical protein
MRINVPIHQIVLVQEVEEEVEVEVEVEVEEVKVKVKVILFHPLPKKLSTEQ